MSSAVVVCLDRNKLADRDDGLPSPVFYEAEAVRCMRSWRDAAGWDGAMYAVQYEDRKVSSATLARLASLGADVVTLSPAVRGRQFMEVVQALAWAEDSLHQDRIVYSDLDVSMTAPLPPEFFAVGRPVLYVYTSEAQRDPSPEFRYRLARARELGIPCHNTYFQAFDRSSGLHKAVLSAAGSAGYTEFFRSNVYYAPKDDDYFFEEGAYDYVCANGFETLDLPCPSPGDRSFFVHRHMTAAEAAKA